VLTGPASGDCVLLETDENANLSRYGLRTLDRSP